MIVSSFRSTSPYYYYSRKDIKKVFIDGIIDNIKSIALGIESQEIPEIQKNLIKNHKDYQYALINNWFVGELVEKLSVILTLAMQDNLNQNRFIIIKNIIDGLDDIINKHFINESNHKNFNSYFTDRQNDNVNYQYNPNRCTYSIDNALKEVFNICLDNSQSSYKNEDLITNIQKFEQLYKDFTLTDHKDIKLYKENICYFIYSTCHSKNDLQLFLDWLSKQPDIYQRTYIFEVINTTYYKWSLTILVQTKTIDMLNSLLSAEDEISRKIQIEQILRNRIYEAYKIIGFQEVVECDIFIGIPGCIESLSNTYSLLPKELKTKADFPRYLDSCIHSLHSYFLTDDIAYKDIATDLIDLLITLLPLLLYIIIDTEVTKIIDVYNSNQEEIINHIHRLKQKQAGKSTYEMVKDNLSLAIGNIWNDLSK